MGGTTLQSGVIRLMPSRSRVEGIGPGVSLNLTG